MSRVPQTKDRIERKPLDAPRNAAIRLINSICIDSLLLSEAVQNEQFAALPPDVKARAARLANTALRYAGRSDHAAKPFLETKPPLPVQNLLRLGIAEIMQLKAPAHGVINTLVDICRVNPKTRGYKGLLNAVLRKSTAAAEGKWDKSPVPALPKWLRKPLIDAYGNAAVMAMETAHMKGPKIDLTVLGDANEWAEKLNGQVLPNGSLRLHDAGQISTLEGYAEGKWWVQDAAATMPADILAPKAGERILDLCAAPGGKTLQMATKGADVTAVDNSANRMVRLHENLARITQAGKVDVQVADVLDLRADPFDAVLLDAPCSATGTIRRHADLPFAKDGTGISELIDLQAKMLHAAAKLVKSGGRMVYCTCSLIPDEGEVQAEEFLAANPDFTAKPATFDWIDPNWRTEEGGLRLRPDYWPEFGGMDGFYIICMERK